MSELSTPDLRPFGFEVVRLGRLEARLVTYDWAWARDNAERIDDNWKRRRAAQPALFDGPVLVACGCAIEDDTCRLDLFETPYSRFLAYRDGGSPDGRVANAFAAIVPWSADGAVLLDGATAWIDTDIHLQIEAGDHDIVVLRVHDLDVDHDVAPLVFHASRYGRLAP